jgi:cytidine deaminase
MTNRELIDKAISVINTKKTGEYTTGNVGAALITGKGNIYCGVCIDVGSGMGFCAEHNAIGAMVTAGEYSISKIAAVWKDDKNNSYILSPCGRCREFMLQIDKDNLEAEVILEENKTVKLRDLLPDYNWCHKI